MAQSRWLQQIEAVIYPAPVQRLSVGQFAYQVIAQQYHRMGNQEQGVLADQDPEYLHQMRVGSRRLAYGFASVQSGG
jgi:hypothetical protein